MPVRNGTKTGGAEWRRLYGTDRYFFFGSAMPVFLSVMRKNRSESVSEAISAMGNANQTSRSTPASDSR